MGSGRSSEAPEQGYEATRIECHRDLSAFFYETLTRALATRGVEVAAPTEHYLVGLLSELGHETAPISRSLVELELDVSHAPRSDRVDKLRALGDQALSVSGLFEAHLERHGITRAYVADVGARAYRTASQLASSSRRTRERVQAEVFYDLGEHFYTYAEVLDDVREATALGTRDDVLSLYERYTRTRSPQLAARLLSHGVFAQLPEHEPDPT